MAWNRELQFATQSRSQHRSRVEIHAIFFSLLISSRSPKTHCLPLVGTSALLKRGMRRAGGKIIVSWSHKSSTLIFCVYFFPFSMNFYSRWNESETLLLVESVDAWNNKKNKIGNNKNNQQPMQQQKTDSSRSQQHIQMEYHSWSSISFMKQHKK